MLTLRKLLTFGGLKNATVLAGANGLDAEVVNLSVLEVAESQVSRWIGPNELYISSFYAIRDNIEMQKIVIETMHRCGCCGIVLCHIDQIMKTVDNEIIDLCNSLNFPCLVAESDVSYVQIMNPVFDRLMQRNPTPDKQIGLREDFFDMMVGDADPYKLLQKISSKIGYELSLFTSEAVCVYSNKNDLEKENEILFLQNKMYSDEHIAKDGSAIHISGQDKYIFRISRKQHTKGYLIFNIPIETGRHSLTQHERIICTAQELVIPCALALSSNRQTSDSRTAERGEYISDLLIWNFPTDKIAITRGRNLEIDIESKHNIVIVNINTLQKLEQEPHRAFVRHIRQWFEPGVVNIAKQFCPKNLVLFYSDMFILFIDNPQGKTALYELGQKVLRLFEANQRTTVSIGFSEHFTDLKQIPDGYNQAFQAAILGREFYGESRACTYSEVFFYHHVRQLHKNREAICAVEKLLAPLVLYDARNGTPFMETLNILFACRLDARKASEKLFIHRNTLLYRKTKIEEVLGYNPFELPHMLHMAMALQVYNR